jgi:hypothetical protein
MGDDGTLKDLNRGLHNAFNFVRAGLPMYFKRAIASGPAGVKALKLFQHDLTATAVHGILATAKGHGEFYNDLTIMVGGIETVRRRVTFTTSTGLVQDLQDCVLPGTLAVSSTVASDTDNDEDKAVYGMAVGATKALALTDIGALTVDYENATTKTTKLTATTAVADPGGTTSTISIQYERTTPDRVVRVFIVDDDTTDPVNNNYENFLVSLKKDGKDEAGHAIYILDMMNGVSEIVDIAVGASFDETVLPVAWQADAYAGGLASGTDGVYAASDANVKTAYGVYDDKVLYDILYIFDAGYDISVKTEIGAICARRIFPHAYLDPISSLFLDTDDNTLIVGLNGGQVTDKLCNWRMGLGNMEFASLAGSSWGLITDEFNGGRKLWMPPSYKVGALSVVVDNSIGSWNSVMGPRRGVTDFEKLAINLYEFRDSLNAKQVNPLIIDERGIQMFYGNKTLKITASAMQQSHARKTRGRISREMYFVCLDYIAEPLAAVTYNGLQDELDEILNQRYGQALESYSLVVGPPATTQDDINAQTLRIKVGLIFIQIAEEIVIEISVFKNGTDLSVQVL